MKKLFISTIFMAMTASQASFALPQLNIYATGGTIAGSSASATDTSQYEAATLGIDKLIAAVPELKEIAEVKGEQIASVDSNDISVAILLQLAQKLHQDLAGDTAAAVITHGTDTLEETAFFLSLTTKTDKPIVLVGAMRPATAISADGSMNLLQAASVAVHKDAAKRGVMMVMNDRIGSGFYITKTRANTPDAFKSVEAGYLGLMIGLEPHFYYLPQQPSNRPYFDVSGYKELPRVDIIYGYQSTDTALLDAAIENGAKAIVIDATGAGSLSTPLLERVKKLTAQGFPIVRASRTVEGYISVPEDEGIGSGFLNAQKARIMLMLALAQQDDLATIRNYFK